MWDHDYTGRTDDTNLFAMQSDIASAVSQSLKVAVLDDELRAMGELPTANLKAYELYVAGRYQLDLVSHESLPKAIALSTGPSRWTPSSSTPISPAATPTASCSPTRAAGQHAAGGDRLDRRGA